MGYPIRKKSELRDGVLILKDNALILVSIS